MTAQPTDREHELAADLIDRMEPMGPAMRYRTLTQALADQRAKYEAVADELESLGVSLLADGRAVDALGVDYEHANYLAGRGDSSRDAAERIRQVSA